MTPEANPTMTKLETTQLKPLPRYIRRAMLKAALLDGRKPWQDGYDEGFKSGQHHGYQAGYAEGYNKAVQELMSAKADPSTVSVQQPTLVQPVHGIIAGDRLAEAPHD